jgi:hypothetical protein
MIHSVHIFSSLLASMRLGDYTVRERTGMMNKKVALVITGIAAVLTLVGCTGVNNTTDYKDGFYHGGKGKTDWTTRY